MICRESLELNGYRKYPNPLAESRWNSWFYQKAVRDDQGIRYFIDIQEYNYTELPMAGLQKGGWKYEPDIVLYGPQVGECVLRVKVCDISATASVASLEAYVDQLWHKLGCGYYELYGE